MALNDLLALGPFVAAVVVALAVLVVDLIAPGRKGPVLAVSLAGLAGRAQTAVELGATTQRATVRQRTPDAVHAALVQGARTATPFCGARLGRHAAAAVRSTHLGL